MGKIFNITIKGENGSEATATLTAVSSAMPETKEYSYTRSCPGSGNFVDRANTKAEIRRDARADLKLAKLTKKDLDELAKIEYKKTLIENRCWYNTEKANIKQAERVAIDEVCSLAYWRNR